MRVGVPRESVPGEHRVALVPEVVSRLVPGGFEVVGERGAGETAAGTVAPGKALVLGAGVAGLQAIATARRLGAVVTGFDVRPVVREQIESLGAGWLDLGVVGAETEGGYAQELSEEQQREQQDELEARLPDFDVVVTTALIPGRPAPRLIPAGAVAAMRPGSVIVDLAAEAGGDRGPDPPGGGGGRGGGADVGAPEPPGTQAPHPGPP